MNVLYYLQGTEIKQSLSSCFRTKKHFPQIFYQVYKAIHLNVSQYIWTTLYRTVNCFNVVSYVSVFFPSDRNGTKLSDQNPGQKKGSFRELLIQLKK